MTHTLQFSFKIPLFMVFIEMEGDILLLIFLKYRGDYGCRVNR